MDGKKEAAETQWGGGAHHPWWEAAQHLHSTRAIQALSVTVAWQRQGTTETLAAWHWRAEGDQDADRPHLALWWPP